jgi:hypothetical protein
VHTDGSITAAGESTVADELRSLIHEWTASGQAALTQVAAMFNPTDTEKPLDAKPVDAGRHGHRCSCHQVAAGLSGVGSEATERVNAGRSSTGRSETGLGHTFGRRLWRASA